MFEFFFKYPIPVFTKGKYILLGAWPGWVLVLLVVRAVGGLAWLIWRRLPEAAPRIRNWRAWLMWALEAAMVALLLLLLWEPAITVAELKSQQNIIAVLVDDSRSMAIADAGADGKTTRESRGGEGAAGRSAGGAGEEVPDAGVPAGCGLTRLTAGRRRSALDEVAAADGPAATHINAGLRQLVAETSDLPVGAVVLLSDGAENSGAAGDRRGDDQRAAQSPAAGAYDRVRQGEAGARSGDGRCGGGGEGDGGFADDGDGELSSAWLCGAEGDAGGEGRRQSCWRRRR